jgi:hypothetical protein
MIKEQWIGKDLEENGHGQIEAIPKHITKGPEEPHEKHVRIVSAPAKIQVEHLANKSLQRYV